MKDNVSLMNQTTCCGCRACEQICPQKCITMKPDLEGFLLPVVNVSLCIHCGLCVSHCAQLSFESYKPEIQEVYAARNLNVETQMTSTSGGLFDVFAQKILEQNGVVYGCAWNDNLEAIHIRINTIDELPRLHGSKYVQSNLQDAYTKTEKDLKQGINVLFSGTPCQVAGIKQFLGKEYPNLLLIDIICHGVPSPTLFQSYLDWLRKKLQGRILAYDFRNKEKTAWGLTYKAKTKTKSKTKYINAYFDPYYSAFLHCDIYRECCYQCHYANEKRVSDITLGDYWGIEKQHPKFYDDRGVSLVILNNEKGKVLFSKLLAANKICALASTFEQAAVCNDNLKAPSIETAKRAIVKSTSQNDYEKLFDKELKPKVGLKIRIKAITPLKLKRIIKKYLLIR